MSIFCCSFLFLGCIFTSSSNKCAYIATIEDDGRLTLNGARHSSPRNVFEDYSGNPRSAISSLPNSLKSGSKPSKDIIRHIIGINGFIPNLPDTKNYWFKQSLWKFWKLNGHSGFFEKNVVVSRANSSRVNSACELTYDTGPITYAFGSKKNRFYHID